MEAKLATEGLVDLDPELVDDLMDEAVEKHLKDFEEKVKRNQQTAAVLTTLGTVAETFGVRGSAQLATDISNNPPILGNITSGSKATSFDLSKYKRTILISVIIGWRTITLKKKNKCVYESKASGENESEKLLHPL